MGMFHQLFIITTVALIGRVVSQNFTGEDDCPCVSVYHNTSGILGDTTIDYPTDYGGKVCNTHDDGLEPYCSFEDDSENQEYCRDSWCYVDADRCRDSGEAYYHSAIFPGLYFSYSTCGSDASNWLDDASATHLDRSEVLAAIPYFSYPDSWQVRDGIDIFGPTTNDTSGYVGLYVDLMNIMADRAGFTFKWTYVSQASRDESSSAWTACVRDVGKGLLDVCVGSFWTTQDRLGISTFTTSWDINNFYMMVPRQVESMTLWHYLQKPFEPFTVPAWLSILAVVFFTSIIKAMVDGESDRQKHRREDGPAGFFRIEAYECFLEFVSGSVVYGSTSRAAPRIINLGYGVFILITIACYTGNLTAILTTSNLQSTGLSSLQDCIDVQCTICVNAGISSSFIQQYGESGVAIKIAPGSGDYADVADAMLSGICDVGLEDEISYRMNIAQDKYKDVCDYRFLGNSLNWMPVAQPVRHELSKGLSQYLREMVTDGTYEEVFDKYVKGFTPTCDPYLVSYDENLSETASMGYKSLLAPIIISLTCSLIAIMINFKNVGRIEFGSQCLKRFFPQRDFRKESEFSMGSQSTQSTSLGEMERHKEIMEGLSQRDKEHKEIMERLGRLTYLPIDTQYDESNEARCS